MKKNIVYIIAIAIILVLIGYVVVTNIAHTTKKTQNPVVTMEVKVGDETGTIKIELYPDMAPNTVANFVSLIKEGYYNGLTFHRAVEGFMIQGGDKEGTGSGKSEETIKGEFSKNGFDKNTLRHDRGVVSMARADYSSLGLTEEGYNSAFSQFFIMTNDNSSINGLYAAFGKVTEGMEYVDKIAKDESILEGAQTTSTEGESTSEEKAKPTIVKMTVDTFGVNYGTPVRQKAFDINAYIMKMYGLSVN